MHFDDLRVRLVVGGFKPSNAGYVFSVYASTPSGVPLFTIKGWRLSVKDGVFAVYPPAYRVGTKWFKSVLMDPGGEFEEILSKLAKKHLEESKDSRNQEDDFDVTQEE